MQIAVTFRHMEAEEGIKEYVKEKVLRLKKFIENPREAHVVLSVEKFRYSAELTIVRDGVTLNSEGRDRDLYAAVDQMADKMDRQIRERRDKVRRKRGNPHPPEIGMSVKEGVLRKGRTAAMSSLIQRRHIPAKPMSLEEAMAQLKLSGEDALFFINSSSGEMNALHRKNGGYEWMEPSPE
ncbi:MAG: ribosome-associated translation inhibitor RaiA [Deltaproteobacteria bacterium]|nr:ribosome-associated translation inhibitor RaiA [Deltaproteobacteria bacterium]MBM4322534.1 ribosome-associated translation inhibitor RaiA [Deltaproteobacteria bacterium]MBM4346561.1 ribosome-associated translation inhibitor RaiA [Deltaproteobacteria bacterium]